MQSDVQLRRRPVELSAASSTDGAAPRSGGAEAGVAITLPRRPVVWGLGLCIAGLVLAHLVVMTLYYTYFTFDRFRYFATVVNLNQEANPATWFSSFLLLANAGLLAVIACYKRATSDPLTRQWAVLALTFLYISIDETGVLHERTIVPMRAWLDLGGVFFYGWVVLAIPVLVVFGLWYLRFFLRLPPRVRLQFGIAAVVFISGALGVEMIEAFYDEAQGGGGEADLTFALLVAVEEGCEMVGALLLLNALLAYVDRFVGAVRVRVAS
jgi:hypothetical protein